MKHNAMDHLKREIGYKGIEIEDICVHYGLEAMNSLTIMARDPENPDMFVHVSNDPGCFPLVWHDAEKHLPDTQNGWVLAVIRRSRRGDYQEPDYYALATYDHADSRHLNGRWRTQIASLEAGERTVVKWAYLPALRALGDAL